jgi:hypothetical protein
MVESITVECGPQASGEVSAALAARLDAYLQPLLVRLDQQLDKRLVRTFVGLLHIIVQFRHRQQGLLLSELGAYLLGPAQAPAGTKRISNLLRSRKWRFRLIEHFLWQGADARLSELEAAHEPALVVWDASVLEKPESLELEGLCAVRSSRAQRLKRQKRGFYHPPSAPIFVPGMQWLGALLLGMRGVPSLAALRWWTTRGRRASQARTQQRQLLRLLARRWGRRVWHIFDRGFAGRPWLEQLAAQEVDWILRWPKGYKLTDRQGQSRLAWHLTRGKRSRDHRLVWDARRRCYRKTGIVWLEVQHPAYAQPLWLVVSRPGGGRPPWYLLTNQPVATAEAAWQIVFSYARRWQIELAWRFCKSELAFESPRLWSWHNRLKLLLIATLAFAFLLSLLDPALHALREWLLRWWCHRTGKRHREASVPLYRLRSALSRLWLAFKPPLSYSWLNPG